MRIKKISPTTPANGNIENQYGTSQTNAYSEAYANTTFATKDVATTSANGLMSASDKTLLNSVLNKRYFLSPLSKGPTQYWFGVASFPFDVGHTNYNVTLTSTQGGYPIDPNKLTITKYSYGFRAFTSESTYEGLIIEATVALN